jgi:uncharacterized protein YndB with AHSA1/START domain
MQKSGKLKVTLPGDREVVMTRSFDAPRALVWDAMTRPEMIRKWLFAPPGWTMTTLEDDLRVGGKFRWAWSGPDGAVAMSMRGEYREVVPPERVVRTETFEFGCPAQSGEQLASIVLTEQGGKTLLTLRLLYPTKEARDGAVASGMEGGVSAGYDRLEEMVTSKP